MHISKGLPEPKIRTDIVNLILKGLKNKDDISGRRKQATRKPITKEVMAILKHRLRSWTRVKPTSDWFGQ
jgi:hypothetical protein